ncbi:hypothetical protein [Shewanella sp.]|uniref:hypothetical protein n=1 Tax=Shewanella sp. TaxID=50422 RepID=UPI003D1414D1
MNSYTEHHIRNFAHKYQKMVFDQDDVCLFIMLTRDYSQPNSIFRELGDFIAHPDEKNRGILINSFQPAANYFDDNSIEFFKIDSILDSPINPPKGFGSLELIYKSLRSIFSLVNITICDYDRNDNRFREFIFCLIFLLGNFKIKINNKLYSMNITYGHHLSLTISYQSKCYDNHYLEFNILFLGNVWIQAPMYFKKKLENHIAKRFSNGILGAIPYSLDNEVFSTDINNFKSGTVWPLFKK